MRLFSNLLKGLKKMRNGKRAPHFLAVLTCIFIFGLKTLHADHAIDDQEFGKGWKPPTSEQIHKMDKTWKRIVGVKPNKIGAKRINEHLKHTDQCLLASPSSSEEEYTTVVGKGYESDENFSLAATDGLPSSVNNSTLLSFPPIGNQQSEGSCVGWATTYYQATHELGLLNGYNNKSSTAHVLSPRWTYNLLNDGYDGGLYASEAFQLLEQNGAVGIESWPYISGQYRPWDVQQQDWISALNHRTGRVQYISGIDVSQNNLPLIKQLLVNGHVVTYGTYISSWMYTTIKNDPSYPNPYVGQKACHYMNGTSGGHFMTIVGYDDNLWIDVNGNGQIDPGEKGAFLVANSWGSSYGNSGYMWVAYDALLKTSSVAGGPTTRSPIMRDRVYSFVPKAPGYTPKLIAQFSLSHTRRNQFSIEGGIGNTSNNAPSQLLYNVGLDNQGGAYAFDGSTSTTAQIGSFALDLTDVLIAQGVSRYFLRLNDNQTGNPAKLTNFSLYDFTNNKKIDYANTLPINADNATVNPYIDYNYSNVIDTIPPTISITSPLNNSTVSKTVDVVINASDNIGVTKVELYIDSLLYATDTTAPYLFTVDLTPLQDGLHDFTAVAYDAAGNTANSSITLNVANAAMEINVNCGDGAVTYNTVNYKSDFGFVGGSTYSSNKNISNPVYKTHRWAKTFDYNFTVPNGTYTVKLMFAETYWNQPNIRVFNVDINGARVVSNLDVYQLAGAGPYDRDFTVTVTNGVMNLHFTTVSTSTSHAFISGIRILKM